MKRLWILHALLAGCGVGRHEFICSVDEQCGPAGSCTRAGFCSTGDQTCAETGRRYVDSAPEHLANTCVPAEALDTVDGGVGSAEAASAAADGAGARDLPASGARL